MQDKIDFICQNINAQTLTPEFKGAVMDLMEMISPKEGKDRIRYFLISFMGTCSTGKVHGNVSFWITGFPSRLFIVDAINKGSDNITWDIVLLNIYEFQSKEDYEEYILVGKRITQKT